MVTWATFKECPAVQSLPLELYMRSGYKQAFGVLNRKLKPSRPQHFNFLHCISVLNYFVDSKMKNFVFLVSSLVFLGFVSAQQQVDHKVRFFGFLIKFFHLKNSLKLVFYFFSLLKKKTRKKFMEIAFSVLVISKPTLTNQSIIVAWVFSFSLCWYLLFWSFLDSIFNWKIW